MKTPFTGLEVKKAAESLKNRKSVGDDNLDAEFVKYGPPEIHEGVAKLLNNVACTGEYPEQIKQYPKTPPKTRKKARTALKSTTNHTVIYTKEIACHLYDKKMLEPPQH